MVGSDPDGEGTWSLGTGPISAVMLDRDGVINRELGRAVRAWEEFEFLPGVLRAFQQLARLTVPILVVSNQSAIGRGWIGLDAIEYIHEQMVQTIRRAGGRVDEVAFCPHAPEAGCHCRKPRPGLLLGAAQKHCFALNRAVMVGDSYRDVQAARRAGAIPVMVRSGHAIPPELEERLQSEQVHVVADLGTFVEALVDGFPMSLSGEKREKR